jgi:hypothetical protein
MPLVQTRGAASAQGFGEFAQVTTANYIEDVFSTYLYTGQGAGITIANGIDLSTNGGMVWVKNRSQSQDHFIQDTARTNSYYLASNLTNPAINGGVTATYNTTGFSFSGGTTAYANSGDNYCSWTFREQPKFFDIVTYTGDGVAGRNIAHNLGSVPGCIIVKATNNTRSWAVYHRSLGATKYIYLNSTGGSGTTNAFWNDTEPTSTVFTVRNDGDVNGPSTTYVAYLFAHDAGGFGLTGTDNVISCGSYTGNGSATGPIVNLGYEPQWILVKRASGGTSNWQIIDVMRGVTAAPGAVVSSLFPNLSDAENPAASALGLNSTGFQITNGGTGVNASGSTYIYIAIRRGPMKVPTDGTKVFAPITYSGNSTARTITTNFVTDLTITRSRTEALNTTGSNWVDRLRGKNLFLDSSSTSAEQSASDTITGFDINTGYYLGTDSGTWGFNKTGENYVSWDFQRAPSFFDEVCYTGTGSATTQTHNLGVVPEMMIVKRRDTAGYNWNVYLSTLGASSGLWLNNTTGELTGVVYWNSTSPTSSVFSIGSNVQVNASGGTYVAYLFATCAGVSKVGSYTGNGTTQTINCGFTAGARFVLIKRTDTTGDWYVYDTARGMTVLTDPYLWLNSTNAEVATLGSVTTVSTGFALNSAIVAAINVSAGTYIFLAIA